MPWQPSTISSWISWVPEALSSISTTLALKRLCCSRTARLQRRKFEPLAPHVEEKEVLAFDAPSRADTEIAELGGLVGGIPTLHDPLEAIGPFVVAIALEPSQNPADRPILFHPHPAGETYYPVRTKAESTTSI